MKRDQKLPVLIGTVVAILFIVVFLIYGMSGSLFESGSGATSGGGFGKSLADSVFQSFDSSESHDAMIRILNDIQRRTYHENPFLGERALLEAREQVALAKSAGKFNFDMIMREGILLRNLDNTEEALKVLGDLYEDLKRSEDPKVSIAGYQLAVTYLRAAETQNCVDNHSADSCLLPIRGGGVHVKKSHALEAMRCLNEVLQRSGPLILDSGLSVSP